MDIKKEILFKGDHVSLIRAFNYEMIDEPDIVLIIPILSESKKVGIRSEFCPPYQMKDEKDLNWYTAMTGKIEKGEYKVDAVKRELQEEAGVTLSDRDDIELLAENIPCCKSTTLRASVYLVNLYEPSLIFNTPSGDGTEFEAKSKTLWLTKEEILHLMVGSNSDLLLYLVGLFSTKIL